MKNNIQQLLSDIDQLKLDSENHNEELSKLLRKILNAFNCDRAWCLYPCNPESDCWAAPIEVTKYEWPGIFEIDLQMPMGEEERVIFNTFINAKGPVTYGKDADYPMLEAHEKSFKIKSQIATVIYPEQGEQWLLGIHFCEKHHSFSDDEIKAFDIDRKSTRLNSSHRCKSYAVFCLKKKNKSKYNYKINI